MRVTYDDGDDVLLIEFSKEPLVRDVFHGWNVNVGYSEHGIAGITILDAKAAGYWPLENAEDFVSQGANQNDSGCAR
ncbi:DUF2283 domain-containing protein [Paraburkholderia sediminicola]|uniref:DUF2283 domain-containing protein n=1 Tax=Paraburkholderia sediminicola TaxID=458836 RepID=UPI0038BCCC2A